MELRCYSYDGGAPPMDSWPLEEWMGVVRQAALQGLIKAHQATTAGLCRARATCWAGLAQRWRVPSLCLFEISAGRAWAQRPEEDCVLK